jgi:hypothetical protein
MNTSARYQGVCPKCGAHLVAKPKKRFLWPEKEWRALWAAFDRLMKVFK